MMDWLRFIFSFAFVRTMFRIGFVWLVALSAMWAFLHFYGRHGASQDLPEVRGLLYQDAEATLTEMGLQTVHMDSVYSSSGRSFEVIEQLPPPGSGIKSGRRVYLTTYQSTPPKERLGVKEGQDLTIARIILENKGFEVEERQEPNVSLVGRVIRTEDGRGNILYEESRLRRGSVVRLVSGSTTDEMVIVPNVRGLLLDAVRAQLEASKLSLGLVEYSVACESLDDSLEAVVIRQHLNPSSRNRVPAGTELDLYLGRPREAP